MPPPNKQSLKKSTRLILPYFRQRAGAIAAGLLSLALVDFLQLFIPRVIKRAVDDLTSLRSTSADLLGYALVIVGLALLIAVFRYIWRRLLLGTSRRIEEGLRNRLFAHIQTLSAAYFDRVSAGELMAHATNDIKQVRMAAGMGLVALNDAVVLGMASVAFMVYIDLRLTAFVLIPMPCIALGTRLLSRRMHRHYRLVQRAFAGLTETVRERFAGIRVIKAYTRETAAADEVSRESRAYVQENLKLVRTVGLFFPMMLFFTNLSLAIVLYLGGRMTILGTITPGDFVAFIYYLSLLTWPMMALGWVTNLIQRGRASLERIDTILQTRPAIHDAPEALPITKVHGEIVFQTVRFSYRKAGQRQGTAPALDRISFGLTAGQTLGLVGPPGSGKTTLLNLIPRLYDVDRGRILLDGRDIRRLRLEDLRAAMACVPQEPFLFAGTIRENITLGNAHFSQAALEDAARQARVYNTVLSFPHGFDTVVGEKGVILSGGQKQRIALARAFLQRRPFLILDDPVSQLDVETGNRIMAYVRSLHGRRTVVIASHRLSALRHADLILSLQRGRIVESGNHYDLSRAGGYYARMYRLQKIRGELDEV